MPNTLKLFREVMAPTPQEIGVQISVPPMVAKPVIVKPLLSMGPCVPTANSSKSIVTGAAAQVPIRAALALRKPFSYIWLPVELADVRLRHASIPSADPNSQKAAGTGTAAPTTILSTLITTEPPNAAGGAKPNALMPNSVPWPASRRRRGQRHPRSGNHRVIGRTARINRVGITAQHPAEYSAKAASSLRRTKTSAKGSP